MKRLKTLDPPKNISAKCQALLTLVGKLHIHREVAVVPCLEDGNNQERVYT